jgi:hypothetical protein
MNRTALLILPAFAVLVAHGFASDPASEQKAPTAPKAAAAAKIEKTSPFLENLFTTGKVSPMDTGNGRSEVRIYGDAGLRVTAIRK